MTDKASLAPYNMPLKDFLAFRLNRTEALLSLQATRILRETAGLSVVNWRILVLLHNYGPMTPVQIRSHYVIDKGQLSRVVQRMISNDLLKMTDLSGDQRSFVLNITAYGLECFERAREVMAKRSKVIESCLNDDERKVLFAVLDRVDDVAKFEDFD